MASPNLRARVADKLIDKFPGLTLSMVEEAIERTKDIDQKDDLFDIRRDLKALIAKGKE